MSTLVLALPLLLPGLVAGDFEAHTFWHAEVSQAVWEAGQARAKEADAVHCAWHCMDLQEDGGTCNAITFDKATGVCLMGLGLRVAETTRDTGLRVAWASSYLNENTAQQTNWGWAWFAVDNHLRAGMTKIVHKVHQSHLVV